MADPRDAAAKARIINHMNGDHASSLSLYLQYFCKLPARASRGAKLEDLSLETMTMRTRDGKTHAIPFQPPMASWMDARTRTVDMDREARTALDISSIRIQTYIPPSSIYHVAIFGICLFTFTIFALAARNMIVPGTWFYDRVLPYFPGGPRFFVGLAKTIALPVVAIHLTETWYLDKSRLRKYGVEQGTALWWKWAASCFVEGAGCFRRIDAEVKRKESEAAAKKH